ELDDSEEYEDAFIIDLIFLENTQALLHDNKSEEINLNEIESKNSDFYKKTSQE
ncbi:8172_t:CDS:1, partial [Scutellospora calospora]